MNRRSFIACIAALPLVGRIVRQPKRRAVQVEDPAFIRMEPNLKCSKHPDCCCFETEKLNLKQLAVLRKAGFRYRWEVKYRGIDHPYVETHIWKS